MSSQLQRSALATALALAGMMTAGPIAAATSRDFTNADSQVASVDSLMRGQVTNGLNPFAHVTNVVLSPTGDKLQYVLFDAPYPYRLYGARNGFVAYRDVNIQVDPNRRSNVVVAERSEPHGPAKLALTAAQAQDRLWSRLATKSLYFPGGDARPIDDLLIDPQTGDVKAWVVAMSADPLSATDLRAIPADTISIDEGRVSTSLSLDKAAGPRYRTAYP